MIKINSKVKAVYELEKNRRGGGAKTKWCTMGFIEKVGQERDSIPIQPNLQFGIEGRKNVRAPVARDRETYYVVQLKSLDMKCVGKSAPIVSMTFRVIKAL